MNSDSEGRFMVAVGAVIEKEDGKILLLFRDGKVDFDKGVWEVVYGRMKQFEEPEAALGREVFEETGIKDIEIIKPVSIFHIFRGERVAEKELVGIVYWVKTRQTKVKLSAEHTDYRWVSSKQALDIVTHPGIKKDINNYIQNISPFQG